VLCTRSALLYPASISTSSAGFVEIARTPTDNSLQAPLPLDPALAEVIFEWRRKTEFSADSDFVFASPFMAGEKPHTPWNMQHNHLSPAAVKAGLGPIGWHTLRHTYRAWLGDNGEALTVQKELMRHASIQTTLNTYGGGMMESMREAHGRVVKQAMPR